MTDSQRDNSTVRRSRRELLRAAGRVGAFGALGALGGALLARGGGRADACARDGLCGACPAFDNCGLPEARRARQNMKDRAP